MDREPGEGRSKSTMEDVFRWQTRKEKVEGSKDYGVGGAGGPKGGERSA